MSDPDGKWEPREGDLCRWRDALNVAPRYCDCIEGGEPDGKVPCVAGGQGRPASEVWTTGLGCAWIAAIVLAACLVGLVALAAGWWAS